MACSARRFDLLRNAPRSSIHIHFGVALLVLTASLTSVSLSKNKFFDRLKATEATATVALYLCKKQSAPWKAMYSLFQIAPPAATLVSHFVTPYSRLNHS